MLVLSSVLGGAGPWLALVGALAVLLVVDLALVRGREMGVRTAAIASAAWVGVALSFFVVLLLTSGGEQANAFLAGYLVEKSLSLDNVFVFLLVFSAFALPVAERHRLLTYGVVLALVLRGVFIVAGAALLDTFGWVSFIFAAFLVWTGWRMFRHRDDHEGEQQMVDGLRARLPLSENPAGRKLAVRENGRLLLTTAGAALVAIALVDVVFAVDSVPAILAITDDTFIVFAANAFALLGLRPLFFLVADLVERLRYLKTALAALLIFIGLKMFAGELVGKIGPEYSLPAIALILGTGVVASLLADRRDRRRGVASSVTADDAAATDDAGPGTPSADGRERATAGVR
jgi:tellurite resistance protein TerC